MISRILKRQDQHIRQFHEMARRFSVDIERDMTSNEVHALTQAILKCGRCGDVGHCEAWMASNEGSEGADRFCPNAETFRKLGTPKKS